MDPRPDQSRQKILFHLKEVNKVYYGYVTREGESVWGREREEKNRTLFLQYLRKATEDKLWADTKCTYSNVIASFVLLGYTTAFANPSATVYLYSILSLITAWTYNI